MLVFDELPTAFPWYDKIEKQNRYRPHGQAVCDYKLISPRNTILPFEIRRPSIKRKPVKWTIHNVNTDAVVMDISNRISLLRYKTIGEYDYITFNGYPLAGLDLGYGFYYCKMTFSTGATPMYSEMFHIPEDSFLHYETKTGYVALSWWNSTDFIPFYYNDIVNGGPFFKNFVFLDSFIHASEPEIIEDATKDGYGNAIPTFQKAVINYKISVLVPEFLKIALVLMQLHDSVYITEAGGARSGYIKNITTNTSTEANGFLSQVDLSFNQDLVIINKNCNDPIGSDSGRLGWA